MRNTVSIVGGGIAGLSTGCYLQMNGYDTQIFESHSIPGGLCTAWKRNGYLIDNCIHWLVGSNPDHVLYGYWNELVDMQKLQFVHQEEFFRVEGPDGKCIRVYADIDRLESEFLERAPEDKSRIRELTGAVRKLLKINVPLDAPPNAAGLRRSVFTLVQMLPLAAKIRRRIRAEIRHRTYLSLTQKWMGISISEYSQQFRNPLLRSTIGRLFVPEMAMLFALRTLVNLHERNAGYPIGGSLNFARLVEKRYLDLGGEIHYKARVKTILTDSDVATGIVLDDGRVHRSDAVISAADGHATIYDMLEGKYLDDEVQGYYDRFEPFASYLQVALGVARTFENEPHTLAFPVAKKLTIDSTSECDHIDARIFSFDPTMAPKGKTILIARFLSRAHTYWEELRENDRTSYNKEKERIANAVIDAFEQRFGGIRENLEMVDVSTPATVIRYTNNWKGSFEGWMLTPAVGLSRLKKILPGLGDFYMVGHWVEPGGGLPSGLRSGRSVAQMICTEDGKPFTTEHF